MQHVLMPEQRAQRTCLQLCWRFSHQEGRTIHYSERVIMLVMITGLATLSLHSYATQMHRTPGLLGDSIGAESSNAWTDAR